MEQIMIFDQKTKTRLGAIAFLPGIMLFIIALFYVIMISPLIVSIHEPATIMTYTLKYYNAMLVMLSIFGLVAASVLIYFLVILARVKNINSPTKIIWALLLCTFIPAASILFWFFVINKEPKYVRIYPNIA